MAKNVTIAQMFEKIGRMYIQLISQDEELLALRQQNSELSRAAGESLRALEAFGHKDIADKILKGESWYETASVGTPVAAETAESGSPGA